MHDPADHASVIGALDTTHILANAAQSVPIAHRSARTDFCSCIFSHDPNHLAIV